MTRNDFKALKQKLAEMPAEALAKFITELAVTSDRVLEATEIFVERKRPTKLVAALKKQLQTIKSSDRYYNYREARVLFGRLDDWLDRIEQDLVPQEPTEAIELLGAFFQSDNAICGHADDSDGGIGMCFHRAAEIMANASVQAGRPPNAARSFRHLMQSNDYGVRDHLYDHATAFMTEAEIRSLIDAWRTELAEESDTNTFDYKRHSLQARCAQFARSIPDGELFAEIKLAGQSPDDSPALAVDVAKVFLKAGQPNRARDFLPVSERGLWSHEIQELKLRIHEELGEGEAVKRMRWQQFCNYPSERTTSDYLKRLPEAEHESALKGMRAIVDEGEYNWRIKAQCYLDWNDTSAAAAVIECYSKEARKTDYYTQSTMAGQLAKNHPLAATILLRGAAEGTVTESKSKHYGYAVRYIQKLEILAKQIHNWGNIAPHDTWWETFMEAHRRKTALMAKLKKAGVELTR